MDQTREDRIYELQQALAGMVRSEWTAFLDAACALDEALRHEVLRRQIELESSPFQAPAAFAVSGDSGEPKTWPLHASELPASSGIQADRFEIRGPIGSGGFGVVYEAFDRQQRREIAIKSLRVYAANDVYSLKREFRILAGVRHRNLVKLFELFVSDSACFFSMELVRGRHVLDRMRELVVARDRPAIRALVSQIVDAVNALHEVGKLHRDIKPSNVLVAEDGRVVVLDFGITSELGPLGRAALTQLTGTPLYVAPEVVSGAIVSRASDWYSLGVILFEALAGRPPFQGDTWALLRSKTEGCRPDAHVLDGSFAPELVALSLQLLEPDPDARPGVDEIRRTLGGAPTGGLLVPRAARPSIVVGRDEHLSALRAAFNGVKAGRASVVYLEGESGLGKSALIRRFTEELLESDAAVVLSGRCYESETVPYKAVDSAIDALSHHIKQLPDAQIDAVMPRHFASLARMLPVLGRIARQPSAHSPEDASTTPQDERRQAFTALRDLLARLGDRRPLLLVVDDAQWGDRDSAVLLAKILQPPDVPRMMVLLAYRQNEAATSDLMTTLAGEFAGDSSLTPTVLSLGELDRDAARRLARHLVAGDATLADQIASQSGGNPFLIQILARGAASGAPLDLATENSWTSVVLALLGTLPSEATRLLEALAIAACPVDSALACEAAGVEGDAGSTIDALRDADLVKTVSSAAGPMIETYHDRIRETVVRSIADDRRLHLHRRLAETLGASTSCDAEAVARHYEAAGDTDAARRYALRAADAAMAAFAFDRAVCLLRDALPWLDQADRAETQVKLGDALALAGRGAEAADAYLAAAERSEAAKRIELLRRAAEQLLLSGNVERGLAALRTVLGALRLRLPRSSSGALASLLYRRALVAIRGLRFRERQESALSESDRIAIDTCWSASVGLSMVDTIRGADFQARHLLLALRAGEPFRVSRALALEVGHRALTGARVERDVLRLVEDARAVSARVPSPYLGALLNMTASALAWFNGRWRTSLERADEAERTFAARCGAPAWEITTARIFSLAGLQRMGDLAEHRRRLPPLIRDARERGNLYAEVSLQLLGYAHLSTLADDEPGHALETVDRLAAAWSTKRFDLQRFWAAFARAEIHLYAGDPLRAWQQVTDVAKDVDRSLLLRSQTMRVSWLSVTARSVVATAVAGQLAPMRRAEKIAGCLEREGVAWAMPQAAALRAAVAAQQGNKPRAAELLRRAESGFVDVDMRLHAAAAIAARAQLTGDSTESDAFAEGTFKSQSVARPARIVATLVPGPW